MKKVNIKKVLQLAKYTNKWVALDIQTYDVLAAGRSIAEVEKKIDTDMDAKRDIVLKFVPPQDAVLSLYAKNKI